MKRKLTAILLVLNVLLVALGFYLVHSFSKNNKVGPAVSPEEAARIRSHIQTIRKGPNPLQKVGTNVVYVTNAFHWSQLESSDYREYIGKLRSIGCPDVTIKDIIITDIMRLYAARKGQFYHNGREFRFWETDEKRKLKASQLAEREKQLAQIDKEIPVVLRELLGMNYEREIDKYFVDTNEDERRLGFLAEEKRDRVLALREEIEGMREKIQARSNGKYSAADHEELRKIDAYRLEQLGQVLSKDELEQFELAASPTADRLRAELIGFEPTEQEFREIYALMKEHDEKYAYADSEHPLVARAKEEEMAALERQLRAQLGEERFADYERSRNPDFQNAALFAELYELPGATAEAMFDVQRLAGEARQRVLSDNTLSEADRALALVTVQEATEKDLLEILGPKILANYRQSSGEWMSALAKP